MHLKAFTYVLNGVPTASRRTPSAVVYTETGRCMYPLSVSSYTSCSKSNRPTDRRQEGQKAVPSKPRKRLFCLHCNEEIKRLTPAQRVICLHWLTVGSLFVAALIVLRSLSLSGFWGIFGKVAVGIMPHSMGLVNPHTLVRNNEIRMND